MRTSPEGDQAGGDAPDRARHRERRSGRQSYAFFQKGLFSTIPTALGWKCTRSHMASEGSGAVEIHLFSHAQVGQGPSEGGGTGAQGH